jgi:hypothetical protein
MPATTEKGDVVSGTTKGWTFEKRRWARPKCNNDIRDRGLKQQLQLGIEGNINEA